MRLTVSIVILSVMVFCCGPKNPKDGTKEVPIEDLQLNEVVHDSLTENQLKSIQKIHSTFSEVTDSSLEETITNFKRDEHPDREIEVWLEMADAFQKFTSSKQLNSSKKKEVFSIILLRSMMTENEVKEKVKFQYLSEGEVQEVFRDYNPTPELLKVKKK